MGKTTFYFGPGNIVEKDFPIIITHPIHEIETWISGMSPSGEIVIYMPPPKFIVELAKKYGSIEPDQKMPIVLTRFKLEGIVNNLRIELHKFIDKLSQKISALS